MKSYSKPPIKNMRQNRHQTNTYVSLAQARNPRSGERFFHSSDRPPLRWDCQQWGLL